MYIIAVNHAALQGDSMPMTAGKPGVNKLMRMELAECRRKGAGDGYTAE